MVNDRIIFIDVMKHTGSYDCELYAIAYATSLAYTVMSQIG